MDLNSIIAALEEKISQKTLLNLGGE